MIGVDDLRAVAAQVHAQRPDWDLAGILTELAKCRGRGTIEELLAAALKAAANPQARTPAAIGFDASWTPAPEPPAPGAYDPLPECAECGAPVPRDQIDALDTCPACHASWSPYRFEHGNEPAQLDLDSVPSLGHSRLLEARDALAASTAMPSVEAEDRDLLRRTKAAACPWCRANPGEPCTAVGSGRTIRDPKTGKATGRGADRPLTHASAHQARHDAAGTGPARIDAGVVRTRATPRSLADATTPPDATGTP